MCQHCGGIVAVADWFCRRCPEATVEFVVYTRGLIGRLQSSMPNARLIMPRWVLEMIEVQMYDEGARLHYKRLVGRDSRQFTGDPRLLTSN